MNFNWKHLLVIGVVIYLLYIFVFNRNVYQAIPSTVANPTGGGGINPGTVQ